ncbi:MAG: hypothetical protein RLZZ490_2062 [Cyanobacteriota bacterium]
MGWGATFNTAFEQMKTKIFRKNQLVNEVNPNLRDIAYSMDALIPGIYLWLGSFCLRLGGSDAEDSYPGTIHSFAGFGIVFPGYQIITTYQGSYDPR